MKQGFVKVAAVTPKIVVADTKENTALICAEIKKAEKEGAKIIVLPELCITGYTCSDLFLQEKMLREARQSLLEIAAFTFALDCIVFVGLPLEYNGKLYNVAAMEKCLVLCRKHICQITMNFMRQDILQEEWKKRCR